MRKLKETALYNSTVPRVAEGESVGALRAGATFTFERS